MIIGPSFVWLHLPKTGGTSTASAFRMMSLKDILVDADETDSKHDSLSIRISGTESAINRKTTFLTLRQLPAWLISDWYHKTISMGLDLPFEPVQSGLFYSLRLGGTWVAADYWLRYFEIEKCDAIIRLEHIEEDANRLVLPLLPEGSPRLFFAHENSKQYTRKLGYFFGSHDLRRIYTNNPLWKKWEQKTYGCTTELSLADRFYNLKRIIK